MNRDDILGEAGASRAEAAGARVTEIIELAERKATEIEEEARVEAKRIIERAENEARAQAERAQEAVARLIKQADDLRSRVGSLGKEIQEELTGKAEIDPGPVVVPEPGIPEPEVDPEPVIVPEPSPPAEPEPEPPAEPEPEPPAEPEPYPEPAAGSPSTEELIAQLKSTEPPVPDGAGGPPLSQENGDPAAARLVAMNMALDGSSREDVESHLAESFKHIADRDKLLEEVFARVGQ